jgi:hypothetical protein
MAVERHDRIEKRHSSAERIAFKLDGTPVSRVLDHLVRLLFETDTTLAEFGSSTTLIFLGAILALPEESLISGSGLFVQMKHVIPEGGWSALFLLLGSAQAAANLTRSPRWRRRVAFTLAVVFAFVGFLGARVTPISLFGAVCKVQAIVMSLVGLHLGAHGVRS